MKKTNANIITYTRKDEVSEDPEAGFEDVQDILDAPVDEE